ncbi:hypothetical protein D1007_22136 [Hordeum vulgare]|nr:hypothetical protein D1007_22136 [Hordeum vulgare]
MPSWNYGDEGSNHDNMGGNLMDMEYFLWEMFREQNLGKIQYKHAYEDEIAKLKNEYDHICTEYHKMVDDVSKMFDWQDGVGKVDYQKAMDVVFDKKKEELEMENLRLAIEQKCIMKTPGRWTWIFLQKRRNRWRKLSLPTYE